MPEGVLIADRSTAPGRTAMHSTAAFAAHRWRSARIPVPGPGSATACPIHRAISRGPLHRFLGFLYCRRVHGTYNGLTTGVDMYMLDCDLLLTLSAIALQGLELHREGSQ
jgi:hypothetical protein